MSGDDKESKEADAQTDAKKAKNLGFEKEDTKRSKNAGFRRAPKRSRARKPPKRR